MVMPESCPEDKVVVETGTKQEQNLQPTQGFSTAGLSAKERTGMWIL